MRTASPVPVTVLHDGTPQSWAVAAAEALAQADPVIQQALATGREFVIRRSVASRAFGRVYLVLAFVGPQPTVSAFETADDAEQFVLRHFDVAGGAA
ncbi:MAG: hypothetical protein IT186_16020 [Acidobacteria bacterium]|nr:hypothetical protein [Acidobacteriota bacterium]